MKFSDFYSNYGKTSNKTQEQLFFEVVGVKVPSVDSLIAWLVLNKQIKHPYLKETNSKPIPLFELPAARKINYLVKSVPRIKELSQDFAYKFKTPDYIRD